MKQVLSNTLKELRKHYTDLSISLIAIAALASFFTRIQIFKDSELHTLIRMLFVVSFDAALTLILVLLITNIEDYLKTTWMSKRSVASLFTTDTNHVTVNIKTFLALISVAYAIVALMTGMVFAASIVFWLITSLALIFG